MIRVLVIDDEALAIRRLEIKLSRYADIDVVGYAQDGDAAINMLQQKKPDLIFVDINMPGADGLEVAAAALDQDIHVIFVTAFNQFAVQAFEQQVVDYLLKPVSAQRLDLAVQRFRQLQKQTDAVDKVHELNSVVAQIRAHNGMPVETNNGDPIWIKDRGRIQKISSQNIEWVEASRDYVTLHMLDEHSHFVRDTMAHFENILDGAVFQRVHRSAIVNFTQIEEVSTHTGTTTLRLRSGAKIRIGRSYKSKTNLKLKEIFTSLG